MTVERPPQTINRVPLYALFAANVISVAGNVMAFIAIPWFVLQTTHSASQTGLSAAVAALPAVLAAFFGGVLVDRIGYKRTSIIADVFSGLSVALVPLLYATVGLSFPGLLVLVFIGALLDAPGVTAREAFTPDLAELAGMSMERATALQDAVGRMAGVIGAPLGGVLIALVGTQNVLWIDAATFAVSALLVVVFVPNLKVKHAADPVPAEMAATTVGADAVPGGSPAEKPSYLRDLAEGLRFIWADKLILTIILVVMVTNFLDAANSGVIFPVYILQNFGSAEALGLLNGVFGGGAFICAMLVGWKGVPWSRWLTLALTFIIVSLRFWVLALYPDLWVLLGLYAVMGLACGFINPILSAAIVERIPPHMRARVFGVLTAGVLLATPLAGAGGLLVDWIGMTSTLVVVGVVYFLTTASLLIIPAMREMDRPAREAVAEAAG